MDSIYLRNAINSGTSAMKFDKEKGYGFGRIRLETTYHVVTCTMDL
jgi:hypothetical protein